MKSTRSDAVTRMVNGYGPIIHKFISGVSSGDECETAYFYFENDKNQVTGPEFELLDRLLADVDEYIRDSHLRAAGAGIDADELRRRAREIYRRLCGGG